MSITLNLEIFNHTIKNSEKSAHEYIDHYSKYTKEVIKSLEEAIHTNDPEQALTPIRNLFSSASDLGGVNILEYLEEVENMLLSDIPDCHTINVFQIKLLSTTLARTCSKVAEKPQRTILLIDDSRMPLLLGSRLLEKEGMKTLTANSGNDGIEVFKANMSEIDLVITDLLMPDINGDEVYRRIKELSPNTTVILATGYEDLSSSKESKIAFADGCIKKPLSYTKLLEAISPLL